MTKREMFAAVRAGMNARSDADEIMVAVERKMRGKPADPMLAVNYSLREAWKRDHGGDASEWDEVARASGMVLP